MASSTSPAETSAALQESELLRSFDRSLPMALLRAREAIMSKFRPILADHDLTEQQWRVLRALSAADTPLGVGELVEQTFLLGPSLSRILVTLERRGLVERAVASDDARRARISISTAGVELVAEIAPRSEAVYRRIDDALGDGDLDVLYRLLQRTASID